MFRMTNKNRRVIAGVIGVVLAFVMLLGIVGPVLGAFMS